MPIYQFKCKSCGHTFDDIVKFDDRNEKQVCPECNKKAASYVENIRGTVYSLGKSFSRMRYGK